MRYELPARKKLIHEMTIPIRWGDMDAMGHLNNTSYFRYMETARIDWLRAIGLGPSRACGGIVIVNAFCNFHSELVYPGDVLVRTYASDPGRTSYESWVTMERTDEPGMLYATGGATTVWVDFPSKKSAPLPDWLRAAIEEPE